MNSRFRWYRIQIPKDSLSLDELIDSHPLVNSGSQGFIKVRGVLGDIIHRFVWRSKISVTQIGDDGEPSFQEVETVNFTDFSIVGVDKTAYLRIENPGRTIKVLLSAIESLVGLGFTCKPVTFDKNRPTKVLSMSDSSKLVGLKVSGALIKKDITARMEFSSFSGFDVEEIQLLEKTKYNIDSASYELLYQGVKGKITFMSNGTVKIDGQLAPRILSLVDQEIPYIA